MKKDENVSEQTIDLFQFFLKFLFMLYQCICFSFQNAKIPTLVTLTLQIWHKERTVHHFSL